MSTTPTAFPKIRATIYLDMTPANVIDMNTLWLRMGASPVGPLAQPIADQNATTFSLAQSARQSIVGKTVLFDSEPVVVTALSSDGLTATVQRWRTAFPFMSDLPVPPVDAHASGAAGMLLQYSDPWSYIAQRYFMPAFQAEVIGLGAAAATFGTVASGSLAVVSS